MISQSVPNDTAAPARAPLRISALVAAIVASALEGYDLAIYGVFAGALARAFFPAGHETAALLLTVATLGVGYIVRPVGGLVLGAYADRAGRNAAIVLTMVLMSLSTGLIGFVPSFASIGVLAPGIVVVLRLIQGFAAGGATSSSVAYLSESAPAGKRGLYASWQQASQIGAFLVSTALGAIIANVLAVPQTASFGWRIPFLLALLFGPFGLWIRLRLREPELFRQAAADAPAEETMAGNLARSGRGIAIGFGVTCLWSITGFLLLIFMPTYANRTFGIPLSGAFLSGTIGGAIVFVLCPLMGALSDRIGRRPTMAGAALLIAVSIYPLFAYVNHARTVGALITVQAVLGVLIAGYTGPVSAFLAELFPTRVRSTGLSVAYNIAVLVVGAFAPLVTTSLIVATGNPLAPAFYVIGGAVISLVALLFAREHAREYL